MLPGERFRRWADETASGFADRLATWALSFIARGIFKAAEDMEPGAIEITRESLTKLKELEGISPEISDLIDRALTPGQPMRVIGGYLTMLICLLPALLGAGAPLGRGFSYNQDRLLHTYRLDPMSIITAWRRDPAKYEKYFEDLRDLGWAEERIEALKFITLFMPSALDIVSWYAKEVYEPDMIERYGLDSELPAYETTDFPKIGVDATQARNYWMAHWEHASYMQIREMLHRGVLSLDKTMPTPPTTEAEWEARDEEGIKAAYDWYRLVEIPPFWRARLTEMMFEVPTRVDVRRFWDMRTIDEERLRSIYHSRGYHGKDLDDYVLWTKVYVAFPDLMARWKNGWITLDELKAELTGLGMPEDRLEEMIQTKIKAAQPERTATERELTKTDIIKGVKEEVITRSQGIELLMDLGYDEDEAVFIMESRVAAEAGSPETFAEFKDLTQKYRVASGMEAKPMPEEIKQAAAEVVKLTGDIEALQRSIDEEKAGLIEVEEVPEETTKKLKGLQVKLHRAEAKLAAAKSEYDKLVAEWRH